MRVTKQQVRPLLIIGILFFVFGFVTWLGSVLIPYLRIACELNGFQSFFVAFAFYISYTFMALPASGVLKWTGLKKGMTVGLLIMAAGALLFIPAAYTRQYFLFLTGLFIQGAGLTILQTAANPFVTLLGPAESAAKRISVMGICNGIAGVMAPIILGSLILKDTDGLQSGFSTFGLDEKAAMLNKLASKVIFPYALIAASLVFLSLFVHFSGLPEPDKNLDERLPEGSTIKKSIWQFPHLWLGVITLFFYVGVEVIAVDTIAGYAFAQGISLSNAKFFASLTLLNMLAGYLVGILCIPKYITQEKALTWSALAGLLFSILALTTKGMVSVTSISLLGLANALMWPSIWPLAIAGLGKFTKTGSSLLIMSIGGGAVLPLVYGYLSDRFSAHLAYLLVIPAYLMILFYAVHLHKIRSK